MTLIGWQHMVRYFRRGTRIYQASFEHPAPSYRSEYTRLFDGVERFDQSFTGIVFDRALLSASQLNGDAELYRVLEVQAEARTARLGRKASYAERVRHHLLDAAQDRGQDFDMGDVARALGVSVRTLRRRLQEEGVTYSTVAGEAFADLAKRLLVDEERSVEETAYAMGFSAPTSFHKAFKRWTGTTPKVFRQRHERAAAE
jgi:AraC-like DNA-binding protein